MGSKTTKSQSPARFGRELRKHRMAAGMTLDKLARRSRLTPNYVGSIENGHRDPSLSTIVALAGALDVEPAELLGGVSEPSSSALQAARLIDSLSPKVRKAVAELLRAVARRH
jgi:transcriptional regulator with XRE-family HTH domain